MNDGRNWNHSVLIIKHSLLSWFVRKLMDEITTNTIRYIYIYIYRTTIPNNIDYQSNAPVNHNLSI